MNQTHEPESRQHFLNEPGAGALPERARNFLQIAVTRKKPGLGTCIAKRCFIEFGITELTIFEHGVVQEAYRSHTYASDGRHVSTEAPSSPTSALKNASYHRLNEPGRLASTTFICPRQSCVRLIMVVTAEDDARRGALQDIWRIPVARSC